MDCVRIIPTQLAQPVGEPVFHRRGPNSVHVGGLMTMRSIRGRTGWLAILIPVLVLTAVVQRTAAKYGQLMFEDAMRTVWASLWNSRAYDERQDRLEQQMRHKIRLVRPGTGESKSRFELNVPAGVFVSPQHAWAKIELNGSVRVGVDADHRARVASLHTMSHVLNAFVFEEFEGSLVTGAQIERYADIYTSRVSNLLFPGPYATFRMGRLALPHDPPLT